MISQKAIKFYINIYLFIIAAISVNPIKSQEVNLPPYPSYFLQDNNSLTFIDNNKVEIIINFLLENYNITSTQEAFENNIVFPLYFNPLYEGKAKKLQEQIEILTIDLKKFKESGARANLIIITEQLLDRTKREFEKEKIPQLKKTIETQLRNLLKNCVEEYLNIILPFIHTDNLADLNDLSCLIGNAIANS